METRRSRILVVDDEMSIRSILTELLNDRGYEVVQAPSVEVALVKMGLIQFDLLVTDIRMAGRSGIDLLRHVKAKGLETEVIVMTSHASLESGLEAIRMGAHDYLLKPFETLEFVELVVDRALSQLALKRENTSLLNRLKQENSAMSVGAERAAEILAQTTQYYEIELASLHAKDVPDLVQWLARGLGLFCKDQAAVVWILDEDENVLCAKETVNMNNLVLPPLPMTQLARVSEDERVIWLRNRDYEPAMFKALKSFMMKCHLSQPLVYQNKAFGLLSVINRPETLWGTHEKNSFEHMSQIASSMLNTFRIAQEASSAALEKKESAEAEEPANKDTLTPLASFDRFVDALTMEIARSRRYNHKFTVFQVSFEALDSPEQNPDVLAFFEAWATQLLTRIRSTDIAARKGNKFLVLLSETTLEQSRKVVSKIKTQTDVLSGQYPSLKSQLPGILATAEYPKGSDNTEGLFFALDSRFE